MIARIEKSTVSGRVKAPPSKSFSHRLLICSAFADGPVKIKGVTTSDDIKATVNAISLLGANVEFCGDGVVVTPIKRTKSAIIDCGESGSTLRFILPVALAAGGAFTFTGNGRLPNRPIDALVSALDGKGVSFDSTYLPIKASGKLLGGEYVVDGSKSSQFVSGMLLAAPLIGEDVTVKVVGSSVSTGYIDVTLYAMRSFGIEVLKKDNTYYIKGGQKYRSPGEIEVEGDWSAAANLLALGMLCGRVEIEGLNPESVQGDRAVIDILKALGNDVKYEDDAFIAQKSRVLPININVEQTVDIAPAVAAICAFGEGESVISGVNRLALKESDRILGILNMINAVGGTAKINDGCLHIGGVMPEGGSVDGFCDHRIVMAAAVIGARVGGVEILGADAVSKSFPDFFDVLSHLGGIVTYEE